MANSDKVYLQDILDNIAILEGFIKSVDGKAFFGDLEKQFAAARCLEIIGEAAGQLSEDFRNQHPEIDWRGLKSMRNLLIHEYAYVDAEEVWKACETDVPDLKTKVEQIIKSK